MNTIQKGIIRLSRSAVTGEALPLPEGFSLEEAMPELMRQGIPALAYEGALLCGLDRNSPEMQKLFQTYVKMLLASEAQLRALDALFAAFEENGIDYMPLKGVNMKPRYPRHELRCMGDADILIRLEQYDRIRPIMQQLNFTEGVESDHELIWHSKGLMVELHKRLIPSYNKDYFAYFADGWQLAKKQAGCRFFMEPEDEFVYLFTHFAKHYREAGIGVRVVTDLWVFLRCHPELDRQRVVAELDKLRLTEFYENILRLLAVWFDDAPTDEKLDYITEYVFRSGNRGDVDTVLLSLSVRDSRHSRLGSRGHYVLSRIFPSSGSMKKHYPILEKHPALLPVCWAARLVTKAGSREVRARTAANVKALDQANVDLRQKMLNYVGLDYNF